MAYEWIGPLVAAGAQYFASQKANEQPTETTTKSLPGWLEALGPIFSGAASEAAFQPYQPYEGERVAGFSPFQFGAMDMIANRAQSGSPVSRGANTLAADTLSGKYLTPDANPFLSGMVDRAMGKAGSAVQDRFRSGAWGGSANQEVLARTLSETAGDMYGRAYGDERNRQMGTMQMSPGLAAADYFDAGQLMNIGGQQQAQGQKYLDADYSQFQEARDYPGKQLGYLGLPFGFNFGGTSTTYGPKSNPWLDAASAGIGMYGMQQYGNAGQKSGGNMFNPYTGGQAYDPYDYKNNPYGIYGT